MKKIVTIKILGIGPSKDAAFDDAVMTLYNLHYINYDDFNNIQRWYYDEKDTEHYGEFGIAYCLNFDYILDEVYCDMTFHRIH